MQVYKISYHYDCGPPCCCLQFRLHSHYLAVNAWLSWLRHWSDFGVFSLLNQGEHRESSHYYCQFDFPTVCHCRHRGHHQNCCLNLSFHPGQSGQSLCQVQACHNDYLKRIIIEIMLCFEMNLFSNFSCRFLNPNNCFQFEL